MKRRKLGKRIPHIWLYNGIWYCGGCGKLVSGFSYKEAFFNWERVPTVKEVT